MFRSNDAVLCEIGNRCNLPEEPTSTDAHHPERITTTTTTPTTSTTTPTCNVEDARPRTSTKKIDNDDNDDDDNNDTDPPPPSSLCCLNRLSFLCRRSLAQNWEMVRVILLAVGLLTYLAYFTYCMQHKFGSETSVRLLVGTILGLLIVARKIVKRCVQWRWTFSCGSVLKKEIRDGVTVRRVVRWGLYMLSVGGAVVLLAVDVVPRRPEKLVSLAGLALLILFSFLISRQPHKINWHAVFWGMSLQFWFAVLIRKTSFGSAAFQWLADRFVELLRYTDKGSETVFGISFRDHAFVFQLMPTLIFFNALISALYFVGLVQIFVATFGKFLGYCLGTSPIECVNSAANLFLTLTEAAILLKPFMAEMTQSEVFAVLTGGFASIAGFLLYTFAAFGAPIDHILTASVMSAPAALAFAKLIFPDDRKPTIKAEDAYTVDVSHYGSLLGALAKGAKEGLTMAGYVVINLIVFVALLDFMDHTVLWFAERAGVYDLTFSRLVSYLLYPLIVLMGYDLQDCLTAARLLGINILTTTPVTYIELGTIITNDKVLMDYISTTNGTWSYVGDDVLLHGTNTTLVGGVMTERSGILATYMVCGLSSMGAIGVAIGAMTSLAPSRSTEIYRIVPLALLAGNIASFSTACVAVPSGKDCSDPEVKDPLTSSSLCCLHRVNFLFRGLLARNWTGVKVVLAVLALLAYLTYFAYCMYYEFGGEPSIRLLVGTIIGALVVANKLRKRFAKCPCTLTCSAFKEDTRKGQLIRKCVRWSLYILSSGGAVAVIAVDVVPKRPENLICVGGLAMLILFSYLISRQPDRINWHAVYWGIGLQFWFAVLLRKTTFGANLFEWLADRFVDTIAYTDKGSEAVFGKSFRDHNFVFQALPTLIFFNAVISVCYYLGLVQWFIATFGKFLAFCLGTSPIECVNAAANLFLTLSEAPILIKPFMPDITQSELFAVMTGGFASIAGFLIYVLGAYGAPINHLLTASVMSAPAALAFAKLIFPDERKPTIKAEDAYKVDIRHYGNLLGALSKGAKDGLYMAGLTLINVLVYVAVLECMDQTLMWFAERAGVPGVTFTKLVSYVFYPLTFMMGFALQDCLVAGRILGVKIFSTTILSFIQLGTIVKNSQKLEDYISVTNGTWNYVGDDILLHGTNTTLVGGVMTERSGILATYMACGLSNLGAIGVAIGAFTFLAPSRSTEVYRLVPLALLAGNIASFSTACVAEDFLSLKVDDTLHTEKTKVQDHELNNSNRTSNNNNNTTIGNNNKNNNLQALDHSYVRRCLCQCGQSPVYLSADHYL
ncbi:hypothetical protein ACOMHN_029952 [Nucella lapillus]